MKQTRLATVSWPLRWAMSMHSINLGLVFKPKTFRSPTSPFTGSMVNASGWRLLSTVPRSPREEIALISSRSLAAFSKSNSVLAWVISAVSSRSRRFLLPSKTSLSPRIWRRYSSRVILRLQGAVQSLMLCKRQGRYHLHLGSFDEISREQLRYLNTL